MNISRRAGLLAASSAILALGLSACGSASSTEPTASATAETSYAPVSIEHIYGETEITKKPSKVATISWVNADALLALGTVPVGMDIDAYGQNANNSTDWKDAKLEELGASIGSEKAPTQYDIADGVNFDEIARSKPDVIFAAYSGLTQEQYDKLSKIAPTVGPLKANYLTSWQDTTEAAGDLLGKSEQAEKLVSDLEGELSAQTEKFPALKDATFASVDLSSPKTMYVYATGDNRPRFLTSLGMKQAEIVTKNTPKDAFFFEWSPERANELDADVVFASALAGDDLDDVVKSNKLYGQLPAAATDSVAILGDDQAVLSVSAASPLSIEWAIDNVVPTIAKAAENAAK
ncbi:ABC transporter substrate-binding protein [Arthrobacter sp. MYb211]|uniref:ABC transporter substrate-binding protein n=1 Tax=unclassified Arthrobacter TaxID=235627 RepID=UPI000CFDA745|nr:MULTISPECIES: ABC transporter substrate-binding protein [unclassified Arthrobacter]PRA08292.1 ABC transporter substrate-binding protein [Arthrobacter sp. MYb221]PRC02975.1 ABC transporter substrate-binding protein [Arthrobacter sp. MYb211]